MTSTAARIARATALGLPIELARRVAGYAPVTAPAAGTTAIACDLDRTLVYSAAALGLTGPDSASPRLVVMEVYRGAPTSFATHNAGLLLATLSAVAPLVPTTTRTVAQYARVQLTDRRPAYAVTSNGGRILVDDRVDPDWSEGIASTLSLHGAPVGEVDDHVRSVMDPRWVRRQAVAEGLFTYIVVHRAELPAAFVADLQGWCVQRGWTVSLQGRKLYCMPRALDKSRAVAEVMRRVGGSRLLAAGDSLLDAKLLATAEAAIRPAHGELHDLGWQADHLTVTDCAGVLAGEEIAARLLAMTLSD